MTLASYDKNSYHGLMNIPPFRAAREINTSHIQIIGGVGL
ncbi:hypothetical protein ymoll0001_32610 [Yersinia mollaretii ATCC 43969]|uniref:Uncharacterized protein n=1 Tax=Yersinia mollaretii (strain ATCC 43969 / DSM 18520 / CIP 103324 / CNY 7263 / WAIP 204) TaxID=349967 RepID=A0ABP2E8Y9_YERMW|nr:hypothetical protein ymoll0001_32610 [Yersinia mollaretii ATCC 43969]